MNKQEIISKIIFEAERKIKQNTGMVVSLFCKSKEVNSDNEIAAIIIRLCAEEYGITVDTLIASGRVRLQCEARQMSMKLIKDHTALGLKHIGLNYYTTNNKLGKDHTTIISAIKTIDNLLTYDKFVKEKYDRLVNNIMLISC
jgi:chromosomal replication initiation ATPase DnaA